MYQVSINSLLYFQMYTPDKLFIAKIKKGSNSIYTGDRVMAFFILQFPAWPSISVSSFIKLLSVLLEICPGHKCDGRTDGQSGDYMLSLRGA